MLAQVLSTATRSKMSVLGLVLAFNIAIAPVLCDKFTIVPSASSNCPGELTGEVCLTLQQYASSPSQSSDVILLLQPGLHGLMTNFLASSSIGNFSMSSVGATVACDIPSRSLTWTHVENISITGVSFTGCADILIDKAINVKFINVSIVNGGRTSITHTSPPYYQDPVSNAVLLNVTFQKCQETLIWLMNAVVFENVSYNYSKRFTVQASASGLQDGTQTITYTNATFNVTQSLFYKNVYGLNLYRFKSHISNSTFIENINGGFYAQAATVTIENSVFWLNVGGEASALKGWGLNLTVTNCTFSSNFNRYKDGAAMLLEYMNYLKVQDSVFFNNSAVNGGGISFTGGALMLTACIFNSNTATHKGGAIHAIAYYPENSVITSKSRFVGNSAADGGAIYVDYRGYAYPNANSTVYSTGDVFEGNTASGSGGAIYSNITTHRAVLSVRYTVFRNNIAAGVRGGAVLSAGVNVVLSFVGSTFDSNSASSCGVVDASNHVTVEFDSSSFTDNVATGDSIGGGVACVRSTSVSIRNDTFTYNKANLHAGVLYIDNSSVRIWDSTFLSNFAAFKGGVMYTQIVSTDYFISHSAFSYNSAGESGGVMYLSREENQATVTGSIISFNRAADRGGAFNIIRSSLNITESNIYNNTADKGSAVSACNSTAQVQGLNSSVDSTQPICKLYEGFVNSFNIVPPHDYSTLMTSPPTDIPQTTAAISPTPSGSNSSIMPYHSLPPTVTSRSSTAYLSYPLHYTRSPTEYPSEMDIDNYHCIEKDEHNKRLTTLVYTFAVIIVVLVLCLSALAAKVIFDCIRTRKRRDRSSRSFSLGSVDASSPSAAIQPLIESATFRAGTETSSTDSD